MINESTLEQQSCFLTHFLINPGECSIYVNALIVKYHTLHHVVIKTWRAFMNKCISSPPPPLGSVSLQECPHSAGMEVSYPKAFSEACSWLSITQAETYGWNLSLASQGFKICEKKI